MTSDCLRKREKKRESEGAREGDGGREGVNEGGRLLLLPFEKAEKLLRALSQEDFGSGGDTGESCLTPASHMSFTHSFKQ